MISVVEYGVGNVGAILNMLDHLGIDAVSSGDPGKIESAERLILPGVGAFDVAMRALRARGLLGPLESAVIGKRVPVLGICLGMQLLARRSEEGIESGLGWIAADVVRIPVLDPSVTKVPHMGWSDVRVTRPNRLLEGFAAAQRFYFAHSYLMRCDEPVHATATFDYGGHSQLCCAVEAGNVMGVQFHPEKSHRFGMQVFRRFAS